MPGSDYLASLRSQQLRPMRMKETMHAARALALWDYLDRVMKLPPAAAESALLGDAPRLKEQRETVRRLFTGFTATTTRFNVPDDAAAYARNGAPAARLIDRHLELGIPVGVSLNVDGLAEWGRGAVTGIRSGHDIVVLGRVAGPNGTVYRTRNSWAGDNPEIPASRLCRVLAVNAVLAPGEELKTP